MKTAKFKSLLVDAFQGIGFSKIGKSLQRGFGRQVVTVIDFNPGFAPQWFIDVGFWLTPLGGPPPRRTEQTHLYFRLDALLPDLAEVIRTAGCLEDSEQPEALEAVIGSVPSRVDARLRSLESAAGLVRELPDLERIGLVTREAKDYLAGLT